MELKINGQVKQVDVEDNMPLLWVLRDELNMTGTKYGCGVSSCGACTVMIDGVATRTCTLSVSAVVGKEIKTIEGVAENGNLSAVQKAWIQHQVPLLNGKRMRLLYLDNFECTIQNSFIQN